MDDYNLGELVGKTVLHHFKGHDDIQYLLYEGGVVLEVFPTSVSAHALSSVEDYESQRDDSQQIPGLIKDARTILDFYRDR